MNQEKIGKFIAELRKEKGYTQNELANLVNLSDKAVSKWETGKSVPDYSVLEPLSKALGVTVAELLNGEKNPDSFGDTVIDQIKFYNNRTANKFKKIILMLIVFILCIVTLVLGVYVINNFNTCKLYSIKSADENYTVSGNIIYTKSKNVLMIGDIKLRDISIYDDFLIHNYEYTLMSNSEMIEKKGDISSFKNGINSQYKTIDECLNEIKIYINMENNNLLEKIDVKENIELRVEFVKDNGDIESIVIPLKINKVFSNNQLIYSS